ncbi:MAG: hypothetical protein BJ554DRAFT_7669, partial [Olpidium bornovanus]
MRPPLNTHALLLKANYGVREDSLQHWRHAYCRAGIRCSSTSHDWLLKKPQRVANLIFSFVAAMKIDAFMKAIDADQYFALAYFQKGVASFLLGSFEEAVEDFSSALSVCAGFLGVRIAGGFFFPSIPPRESAYLRGNLLIDYQQLGLDYKLYSSEVLYNRGLCFVYMNDEQSGAADLYAAQKEKQTPDHE